jgi:ParB/RepB/Spo0J family partition protein
VVRDHSLLQPIVVTPNAEHPEIAAEFLVLFGERRLRAAIRAGRETVPAVVRTDPLPAVRRLLLQIEENDHRSPLSLHERAQAYRRAVELSGLSPAKFARRHRILPATLSKYLALASADGLLGEALAEHRIHHLETARAFLRLPARYQQHLLANARRTGDPITIGRVARAAKAAEAELAAEAEVRQAAASASGAGLEADGLEESGEAGEAGIGGEAGAGSTVPAPPVLDSTPSAAGVPAVVVGHTVLVAFPYSALCALLRRLGAEPASPPDRARDQLLAILARDPD